jgi:hypothetical protein
MSPVQPFPLQVYTYGQLMHVHISACEQPHSRNLHQFSMDAPCFIQHTAWWYDGLISRTGKSWVMVAELSGGPSARVALIGHFRHYNWIFRAWISLSRIVTGYGLERQFDSQQGQEDVLFTASRPALWSTKPPNRWVLGILSSGI